MASGRKRLVAVSSILFGPSGCWNGKGRPWNPWNGVTGASALGPALTPVSTFCPPSKLVPVASHRRRKSCFNGCFANQIISCRRGREHRASEFSLCPTRQGSFDIIKQVRRADDCYDKTESKSIHRFSFIPAVLFVVTALVLVVAPVRVVADAAVVHPLGSLRVLPPKFELDISFRLLAASLGGAAVGLERSSSDRPAGVRTMSLVGLGSSAFTICSMYGFLSVASQLSGGSKFDPSRMASNVASGVGFIGAGVITNNRQSSGVYDRRSSVNGLTTAAAIWTAAAIGVACGVGLYIVASAAAISTIGILRFQKVKNTQIAKRVMRIGTKRAKSIPSPTTSLAISNTTLLSPIPDESTLALPDPISSYQRSTNLLQHQDLRPNYVKKAKGLEVDSSSGAGAEAKTESSFTKAPAPSGSRNDSLSSSMEDKKFVDPLLEEYLWEKKKPTKTFGGLDLPMPSSTKATTLGLPNAKANEQNQQERVGPGMSRQANPKEDVSSSSSP